MSLSGRMPPPVSDFVFDPAENGLDFMASVVSHLEGDPTPRDLKYATVHLCAAIEVLLKSRLLAEDWELVFEDVSLASEEALRSGAFRSVGIREAMRRLSTLGVAVPERARDVVLRAFEKRNAIQHFGLRDTTDAVRATAAEALNFLISFLHEELREWEPEQTEEALKKVSDGLKRIADYVQIRMKELASALDEREVILTCPDCSQRALEPGESLGCHFCLMRGDPIDVAQDYVSAVFGETAYEAAKGRTSWSIHPCPDCGLETLVGGVENRNSKATYWCCFAEGWGSSFSGISQCERCGTLANAGVDDVILCDYCMEEWFASD